MRFLSALVLTLALAGCGEEELPCLGQADGELQSCPGEGEIPVCDGEVMCNYQPDGSIRSRMNTSSLCMDEMPSCDAVCAVLATLPCANPAP